MKETIIPVVIVTSIIIGMMFAFSYGREKELSAISDCIVELNRENTNLPIQEAWNTYYDYCVNNLK